MKYEKIGLFKQETELKKINKEKVWENWPVPTRNRTKKIFADGANTLFRKEFEYATEKKSFNILLERNCLKFWFSSRFR